VNDDIELFCQTHSMELAKSDGTATQWGIEQLSSVKLERNTCKPVRGASYRRLSCFEPKQPAPDKDIPSLDNPNGRRKSDTTRPESFYDEEE